MKNKGKPKKENNTTFRIDFALANVETTNWNTPLLSGYVIYKMFFDGDDPRIEAPNPTQMHIEDNKQMHSKGEPKEHMKKNLNEIIEKAVKVRQDKILFDVDNQFILEGNL